LVALDTSRTCRKGSQELINRVMQASLSCDTLDRTAKVLAISRQGVFMFEGEEEMAIL
jgi:hypothetical protein